MRFCLSVCFFLACALAQAEQPYPLRVDWVQEENRGGALYARNDHVVVLSLILRQTQPGVNIRASAAPPLLVSVPAKSTVRLVSVQPADATKAWRMFSWTWVSSPGIANAPHDPKTAYRLPWLPGHAYSVFQAPGGKVFSHDTPDSRDAVDFLMPEGTAVTAARGGVVAATEAGFTVGRPDRALAEKANFVRIMHDDGTIGVYYHLRPGGVAVKPGQRVEAGALLGFSGNTGFSSGPHLHFGLMRLERAGDDLRYVSLPIRWVAGNPPVEVVVKEGLTVGGSLRPE